MDDKYSKLKKKLELELGPLILEALRNPMVVEIMLNSDGKLWIEKHGSPMEPVGEMSVSNAKSLMATIADSLNTIITPQNPILEGKLFLDGSRFEGLIPPVVAKPTFSIRKQSSVVFTFDDYVEQDVLTPYQQQFLTQAIKNRSNILVVGGTGSGKTTFTNAAIDSISRTTPQDRLVIIEDTPEIQSSSENTVFLRANKDVSMLQLLKATMRLRPDRILVGEVRGQEALSLLKAWNTGHPGGIATVHANGALAGLTRLEQLIAESGTASSMSKLIAEAVDIVIFIQKTSGGRKIQQIIEVTGVDENGVYNTVDIQEDKETAPLYRSNKEELHDYPLSENLPLSL